MDKRAGQMGQLSKENMSKEKRLAKDPTCGIMEVNTLVTGLIIL